MGEKPIQSMEISQYSIASHRCHFTNKVERGGNVWIVHTHKLHLFRLFSQTCMRVCVHDSYLVCITISSTLDVLSRRCCSKNSTVIFDFRRGEKIFLLFFLFSPIRRRGGARREYRDGRMKGKRNRSTPSCNIVRRSPRWDTPCMAQFWVLCLLFRFILSSNNVLMEPFNPRIFVSWKICIQSLRGVEFDIRYILRKSDPIIQLFACICVF